MSWYITVLVSYALIDLVEVIWAVFYVSFIALTPRFKLTRFLLIPLVRYLYCRQVTEPVFEPWSYCCPTVSTTSTRL